MDPAPANDTLPSPYYQDAYATLYCGDAFSILPALPHGSVDLVVSDLPYGVSWQSGHRREAHAPIAGDDGTLDVPGVVKAMCRVLRPCRHLYLFGRYDLADAPVTTSVELVWDKGMVGLGDLTQPWGPQHEPITFAVHVPSKQNRADGKGRLAARLRQGSVIRCERKNSRGTSRHPTEKPVGVLRPLIESSSLIDEVVLDPFAGSGSTLVAAVLEGRRAVGIELDSGYCRTAAERCKRAAEARRALDAVGA